MRKISKLNTKVLSKDLQQALFRCGERVQKRVQQTIAVDTSDLQRSVRLSMEKSAKNGGTIYIVIGGTRRVFRPVEEGGSEYTDYAIDIELKDHDLRHAINGVHPSDFI
jgi:Bacteriophage HK97-gp10, putative tail-component